MAAIFTSPLPSSEMPLLSSFTELPFWSVSVMDLSSSSSTMVLPPGVARVIFFFSSSNSSLSFERVTMVLTLFSAVAAMGGGSVELCRLPSTTGWLGSSSRKPTMTSSSISGRNITPDPLVQ